jgi:type IV secretory pathway VirB10-like protein
MKIMQVTLSIDVQDAKQNEALKAFMDALGGNEAPAPVKKTVNAPEPDQVEEEETDNEAEEQAAEEAAKKKKSARDKKRRAAKKLEDEAAAKLEEEEAEEGDDDESKEDDDKSSDLELSTLREATAAKATKYRKEIKEKLAELGAANVSSIAEDDFQEYYDFIQAL